MKLPFISRSRHENEMEFLERAYAVRADDLRQRLRSLIDKIVSIKFERIQGQTQICVKVQVSENEAMYLSPLESGEYWWHIGQKITESLKREAQLKNYPGIKP